jgi:hypothetical protein
MAVQSVIYFGTAARASSGLFNGQYTAAPTQVVAASSTAADGASDTVSPWITD